MYAIILGFFLYQDCVFAIIPLVHSKLIAKYFGIFL